MCELSIANSTAKECERNEQKERKLSRKLITLSVSSGIIFRTSLIYHRGDFRDESGRLLAGSE